MQSPPSGFLNQEMLAPKFTEMYNLLWLYFLIMVNLGFGGDAQKLKPNDQIARAFRVMCSGEWNGEYEKTMGSKHGWNRIRPSYTLFYDLFKGEIHSFEDADELLKKLLDTIIVRITVDDHIKAITIFETVNARGAHLTVYDLIKALLFSQQPELPDRDLEEEWNEITGLVEESDFNLKKMLTQYLFSRKGYTPPKNVYGKLRDIAKKDVGLFVDNLKDFSKFVSVSSISKSRDGLEGRIKDYLVNDKGIKKFRDSDRIAKVSRSLYAIGLCKVVSAYPLIYSALYRLSVHTEKTTADVDKWIELIEFLERFSFIAVRITHSSSPHGGALQAVYSDHCEKFSGTSGTLKEIVGSVKTKLSKIVKVSEDAFVSSFAELSYSSDYPIIYYAFGILDRFDKNGKLLEPGNTALWFSPEKYNRNSHSVEHFLPQSRKDDLGDPELVNNIGNLLVIHRKDNSKLGDKTPAEKIKMLKQWLKDGQITNKPYLQDFVELYEPEVSKWDNNLIDKRAKDIAKKIYDLMNYQKRGN